MNFWYDHFLALRNKGQVDLEADDIRVVLVMENSTAAADRDAAAVSDFTDLDEYDGAGYLAGGTVLSGKLVLEDNVLHLARFRSDNWTNPNVGIGSRMCIGALFIRWGGTLADSLPVGWFDEVEGTPNFPFNGSGTDVVLTCPTAGWFTDESAST